MALASRREVCCFPHCVRGQREILPCGWRVAGEQPWLLCAEGEKASRWLRRRAVGLDRVAVSSCRCCRQCCSRCGESCRRARDSFLGGRGEGTSKEYKRHST